MRELVLAVLFIFCVSVVVVLVFLVRKRVSFHSLVISETHFGIFGFHFINCCQVLVNLTLEDLLSQLALVEILARLVALARESAHKLQREVDAGLFILRVLSESENTGWLAKSLTVALERSLLVVTFAPVSFALLLLGDLGACKVRLIMFFALVKPGEGLLERLRL